MLPVLPGREVWTALDSFRTGRVFLAAGGPFRAMLLSALPMPTGPVAVAGDAAGPVVATLSARGADVVLTEARRPQARHIGAVALLRARGHLPHLAPQPLYVDAPEAKLPAGGLRPAPQRAALSC
jgi:hypothetical protein